MNLADIELTEEEKNECAEKARDRYPRRMHDHHDANSQARNSLQHAIEVDLLGRKKEQALTDSRQARTKAWNDAIATEAEAASEERNKKALEIIDRGYLDPETEAQRLRNEIMAVKDKSTRLRLISENMELFE